ncbi:hypothetical protein [Spirillospora sp. NBC_01491]|uniref:hypothetical protein n=1 Tax=Spirillospora sp. NBC_01491 TaxID=2976007 RepID=UPI002E37D921|nr:hypothetical protein [Spirillospora sp. NBC_01491]
MTGQHPGDDRLEAALPTAMWLAIVVHDRDQEGVAAVLEPILKAGDWDRAMELLVALAALVPVDVPAAELLEWSHGPHVTDETYAAIVRIVPEGMKRCCTCRDVWPLEAFHRDCTQDDGRKVRCKSCVAEQRRSALSRGEGAA